MKTLINQARFLKAVEYISEHHFSKPYSISPMVGRWFNQLAMIELENGKLLHLTGELAKKHVDVILNGEIVPKKDIELVHKFHAKDAEFEKERRVLVEQVEALIRELADLPEEPREALEKKHQEFAAQEALLETFDKEQVDAKRLYEAITAPNAVVSSALNEESLEKQFKSKIKNMVYRPNHGLTHSVRAAYLTTTIHTFREENNQKLNGLTETELEKLQMMMLFSVVGRRDETGFNDGADGRAAYQSFRATSGREYLKYAQEHLTHLYGTDRDKIYRDAIVVELMGHTRVEDAGATQSELFIDYVREEKQKSDPTQVVTREEALRAIRMGTYSLSGWNGLFSNDLTLANAKLTMMNDAHAIDLTRCYSLYAQKEGGSQSVTVINQYLQRAGLYTYNEGADEKKLNAAFKVLRAGFDTLALTGQNSMFGLISASSFEVEKGNIIGAIKAINTQFTPPMSEENKKKLMADAKEVTTEMARYWSPVSVNDANFLSCYRMYLILKETTTRLTAAEKLNPDKRMFQFQQSKDGDPHHIDHHKNAVSLVNALQTVTLAPGVTQAQLPVITAVTHDKANNRVHLVFDSNTQAMNFQQTYELSFKEKSPITKNDKEQFVIESNREHYQQLKAEQQIEFKQVAIPTSVNGEDSLVDEEGNIDALNLVAHSRALVRLVSTTALSGENFADYDYLLRSLEDPVHNRYVSPLKDMAHFPVDRSKYYDPRSGESYTRTKPAKPVVDVRFQEPVTTPKRFADKLKEGLSEKSSSGGGAKNTIFTKKLAHTLLPPHGKVIPFTGYLHKKSNYFPIGVLSDIEQVDLRDQRYIWSQNMVTASKFWLRDPSVFNKSVYKLLNAQFDKDEQLIRHATGVIAFNKEKIKEPSTPEVLIKYLEERAQKISAKLDEKHYRPTEQALADFKLLLRQERKEYKEQLAGNKEGQKKIAAIYASLENRLQHELERKHPKYAISLRELIEQQKKTDSAEGHNEILAANTKGATKALYAPQDRLFDRLNLAFHALQIKKQYHYDVPLLVLSSDKPPYHYTEALIKADLSEAYKLIRAGTFPFDKSLVPVYELDEKGNVVTDKGEAVIKKNEKGKNVLEPKNLNYQRKLLVSLFQLGTPELKDYAQLMQGQINHHTMDGEPISASIDAIITQMDIVGGLEREIKVMPRIFTQVDEPKKWAFFLRAVTLGHQTLVDEILNNQDFKIPPSILEKAIQLAEKNKYGEIAQHLVQKKQEVTELKKQEVTELKEQCERFKVMHHGAESFATNIHALNEIKERFAQLDQSDGRAKLVPRVKEIEHEVFLNSASRNEKNKVQLSAFINLLNTNPSYKEQYSQILASNQAVKLDQLIDAHQRLGVEPVTEAMALIATEGWEAGNNYLLLIEIGELKVAADYLEHQGGDAQFLIDLQAQGENLLQQIEQQAMGATDEATHDFCLTMRDMLAMDQHNVVGLKIVLQKIDAVHAAVTSPEMKAVQEQIARLQQNVKSTFSFGNQRKADRINDAVRNVPLLERATVFSNEANTACNEVRVALASHRIGFSKSVNAENKVIDASAAESFKNVKKSVGFKEQYRTQKNEATEVDEADNATIRIK